MAPKKGTITNPYGRPKGTPNKITDEIRQSFAKVLENKLPEVEEWLTQTAQDDPAKAFDLLLRLSERFVPKLSQQALTNADGEDLFKNLTFKFNKLSEGKDK